jgi:glycine/D-amino acid oxidase-like deaminating enzyme
VPHFVIETNDGLSMIGEMNRGQFIASGFAGNGITFSIVATGMASDWAAQRKHS